MPEPTKIRIEPIHPNLISLSESSIRLGDYRMPVILDPDIDGWCIRNPFQLIADVPYVTIYDELPWSVRAAYQAQEYRHPSTGEPYIAYVILVRTIDQNGQPVSLLAYPDPIEYNDQTSRRDRAVLLARIVQQYVQSQDKESPAS